MCLKKILVTAILMMYSSAAVGAVSEESKRFNNLGMGMYEQRQYIAAAEAFLRSVETDPTNFLAHYNFACTLSLLREEYVPQIFKKEHIASFDIDLQTILRHLKQAAELHEHRKVRMLEDPDLLAARSTLLFYQIAGMSLLRADDARVILPAVIWRLDYQSRFQEDGAFAAGAVSFSADGSFRLELWQSGETFTGSYSIRDGRLILQQKRDAGSTGGLHAVLSERGAVITGIGREPLIMWNDITE